MDISVVIVNYNVKHFLEQCLYSVRQAVQGMEAEMWVVDNASSDNSLDYLRPRFPEVHFLANEANVGFARACNQGWQQTRGRHVLFLNPDTLLPEDSLKACLRFFRERPDAGALGVCMLDGSGQFLRESKRAFPAPLPSLYKLLGLARLFPRSPVFARYHLGHLDENRDHRVDVLAGAFLLVRREVLEKTGGFDEQFFMYGEDVDLSYRIQQSGYQNYYFSGTRILHFKGESTRKGSLNYVRMFYRAMSVFVRKHYGGTRAGLFHVFLQIAIWLRAGLSAGARFIRKAGLPLLDAGLILLSFWLMKEGWSRFVRTDIAYEPRMLGIAFPAFTVLYLVAAFYAGLYDRWYKWSELFRSTAIATVVLLAGYALLPEQYRFSRAIILFGALLALLLIGGLRWILLRSGVLESFSEQRQRANTLIAGTQTEYEEVFSLFRSAGAEHRLLGRLSPGESENGSLGSLRQLGLVLHAVPVREIIFCQGTLRFSEIIEQIRQLPDTVHAGIHASGSDSVVGSHSVDTAGEAVSVEDRYRLASPYNRRLKRLIDVCIALAALLSFPLQFLLVNKPLSFLHNCVAVLFGKKTWIGYALPSRHLPTLRPGILASNGLPRQATITFPDESLRMMDEWYARDYDPLADLRMIFRQYRRLGQG